MLCVRRHSLLFGLHLSRRKHSDVPAEPHLTKARSRLGERDIGCGRVKAEIDLLKFRSRY